MRDFGPLVTFLIAPHPMCVQVAGLIVPADQFEMKLEHVGQEAAPHRFNFEEDIVRMNLYRASGTVAMLLLGIAAATAADHRRDVFVITSSNDPSGNQALVFRLAQNGTSLTLANTLSTGGNGGASGNAGAVQFSDSFGAVVNFGSNNLTRLERDGNSIRLAGTVDLAADCVQPVSVALENRHAFVLGSNCAESHSWPSGNLDGKVVGLSDSSGAQIAVGRTWAAATLKSGSVLQLPLAADGALSGSSNPVTLPPNANNTPLGAAFWGDILGFNPAHSPDSFALLDKHGDIFTVLGPQPAYPSNAPCWLAKGSGNIWYSGNSPGQAISIFFSDGQGGVFYKSVAVAGVPTDLTVSPDGKWLAVIYTAADGSGARISVYSVDRYGDLAPTATSNPVGVTAFSGVAFSQ